MIDRFSSIIGFADWLISTIRRHGLEQLAHRYYGTYLGEVEDAADPEGRGRVRLIIPVLGQTAAPEDIWARPIYPGGSSQHGMFFPPVKGDKVWIQFEGGSPEKPLYVGGFIARGQAPSEFGSEVVRGLKTPFGHYLRFSDDSSDPHITLSMLKESNGAAGGYMSMDKNGSVLLANGNGSHIYMNADAKSTTLMHETGAMVTMSDSGGVCIVSADGSVVDLSDSVSIITPGDVSVSGGGTTVIKTGTVTLGSGPLHEGVVLDSFMQQVYNVHTHNFVGNIGIPGITLPPLANQGIPMVNSSSKVKATKG